MLFRKLKSKFSKWKSQITKKEVSESKEEPEEILERELNVFLSDNLEGLRKEINKLGKSQLRLNTLAETDRKQIKKNLLQLLEIHNSDQKNRPDVGFIKDLLEVADGLEEAVKAAEKMQTQDQSVFNWLSGIRITQKRIMKLFEKWDVRPIDAIGNPFDPDLHVSVDVKRTSDVPENTVIEEQRRGYLLGNDVIRYAEVVVAKPPSVVEFSMPTKLRDTDEDEFVSEVHSKEEMSQKTLSSSEVKDMYEEVSDGSSRGFILWANDDFID